MNREPTTPDQKAERARSSLRSLFAYRGIGIPESRDGIKASYVAMIPIVALTVLWYVDIQYRGQIVQGRIELHRTDFTVFTEAGAALLDGRDPYRVTNPRGWYYLYPPLFALLVAPLSFLDSQSQVFVWYIVSIALGFGCYCETWRIWKIVAAPRTEPDGRRREESKFAIVIGSCAMLAIACPALDCLQRGQLGIVLVFATLWGFRLTLSRRAWPKAWLGGLVLAWPVVVKLIPALPVSCILLQRWAAVLIPGRARQAWGQAAGLTSGLAVGGILFLFGIPGAAIGWTRNLDLLHEWTPRVATNAEIGHDAKFNIDGTSNQSLRNAAHLLSDTLGGINPEATTDLHRLALDEAIARRHQADRFTRGIADIARIVVLALLVVVTLRLGQQGGQLARAATLGFASLCILLVSPLSWGHYYVFVLPAVVFVPLWFRRQGSPGVALMSAGWLPVLTCCHYMMKPWCGPIGLLGLGTTLWFLSTSALVLFFCSKAARLGTTILNAQPPVFVRARASTSAVLTCNREVS
jgi:hypothetical protein